jgi:hypothetical protein
MHSTPVPLAFLDEMRRRAAAVWQPTLHDLPEGWSKSPWDPLAVLAVFDRLRLREGCTLRAYQYVCEGSGNGVVWVMPEESPYPEPGDCPSLEAYATAPPRPAGADDRVAAYLEGDRSPLSCMQASLCVRELMEAGAFGQCVAWGRHRILDDQSIERVGSPPEKGGRSFFTLGEPPRWRWRREPPASWDPQVIEEDEHVSVHFSTYSDQGEERIARLVDVYRRGSYEFESVVEELARRGVRPLF